MSQVRRSTFAWLRDSFGGACDKFDGRSDSQHDFGGKDAN